MLRNNNAAGGAALQSVTAVNSSTGGDAFDSVNGGTGNTSLLYDTKLDVPAFKVSGVGSGGNVTWEIPDVVGPRDPRTAGRISLYIPSPGIVDPEGLSGPGLVWTYLDVGPSVLMLRTSDRDTYGNPTPDGLWIQVHGGGGDFPPISLMAPGVLPLDTWFRIEFDIDFLAGNWSVLVFPDRTGTVPTHTFSGNQPPLASTWANSVTYGADGLADAGIYWFTDLNLNSAGAPGPISTPTLPLMSTLTDPFTAVSAARWTTYGPVASVDGALQLGDTVTEGVVVSANAYHFDRAELKINVPGNGMDLQIQSTNSGDWLRIAIRPGAPWRVRAEWQINGVEDDSGDTVEYDGDVHRYLKIERSTATESVSFMTAANGLDWRPLHTMALPAVLLRTAEVAIAGLLSTSVDDFNLPVPSPSLPPGSDGPPYQYPGGPGEGEFHKPFDPDAHKPAIDPGSATVLEIVRVFSAEVYRPIRLTGPMSISMVDPDAPLPTGFVEADAEAMYRSTTHAAKAGATVLSLAAGNVSLDASAELVADDVRLVVSDWAVPDRLPLAEFGTAYVQRYTYRFTPTSFRGELEFHVNPTPLLTRSA